MSMSDWRLQGQKRYLANVALSWRTYQPYREGWDHDHCEFCMRKAAVAGGDFTAGYATGDNYHWICAECAQDFCVPFKWTGVKRPTAGEVQR
jgi:hypothetical protein